MYIAAPQIFDGEYFHIGMALHVEGDSVCDILPADEVPAGEECLTFENGTLAPGLIDLQVNGGGGVLLNESPCTDSISTIVAAHRQCGTTSLMPTLISDTSDTARLAVTAVSQMIEKGESAVLGIHLEGPFFNPHKRGIHSQTMLRGMDEDDIAWIETLSPLKVLLTLAPETCKPEHITRLSAAGIRICAGHTDASFEEMLAAFDGGVVGVTHLYNAMGALQSRAPGAVGAALLHPDSWAGIIADGHHVHPAAIALAHRMKPSGKLILVSDSMSTVGSPQQSFTLNGRTIRLEQGKLTDSEGTLAGSAISLLEAVQYAHEVVGLALDECLRMASLYPAACLALEDRLGKLAPGYRADLMLFDDDYTVTDTWLAGEHQSHTNSL
ncbi:N-acetylglucosamine-6-phosphate deacetylase [Parahalioglobus pacificus]|uniref:N-acetylglucosamine-6-phosphate deacetylase n=1 Tax=Parahalioglobus pacificus TaxID=930806 RepID=A0A918XD84_9GAMM|nr:N-acetylglucosamine-6-phosphate deacetylase [Halioglobus pacificus]GHD25372.1 N-acetylglucosamine-6-phosphate deacetylase [Halioglobus pacificus]